MTAWCRNCGSTIGSGSCLVSPRATPDARPLMTVATSLPSILQTDVSDAVGGSFTEFWVVGLGARIRSSRLMSQGQADQ
jgi:hypothetical protein